MYNDLYLNSIVDYKDFLIKMGFDLDNILSNIRTLDDIYIKKEIAQSQLDKLELLSHKCKLYDKDYKDFTIAMGIFIIAIDKVSDLTTSSLQLENIIHDFLSINTKFEQLVQQNLMKDSYVW